MKISTAEREIPPASRLLDIDGLRAKLGGDPPPDESSVYRWVGMGLLPRPIKIGPRASRWFEHEVDAAIKRRAEDRDQAA